MKTFNEYCEERLNEMEYPYPKKIDPMAGGVSPQELAEITRKVEELDQSWDQLVSLMNTEGSDQEIQQANRNLRVIMAHLNKRIPSMITRYMMGGLRVGQ
jgi:hypothetical protein